MFTNILSINPWGEIQIMTNSLWGFTLLKFSAQTDPVKLKRIILAILKGFLNLKGMHTYLLACLTTWTSKNIIMVDLKLWQPIWPMGEDLTATCSRK